MMNIVINGEKQELSSVQSMADLIAQIQPVAPFAVALNTAFVPKSAYESTPLIDGDQVEIVRPVVGG